MTEMLEPISLGFACDVKYQASRNLFFRRQPEASETDFRNTLFRWQGQASPFRRHIFDWMIAPLPAVFAYLERDFDGVFERADLHIDATGKTVIHRDLHTAFPHDFHAPPKGRLTEALVDAQYPDFRSKYEFLAQRFRDLLGTPGSYLYIYREIVTQTDARRLAALLGARSPEHRFQFLFVDVKGAVNQVLTDVGVPTVKGWLPADCDKAADRQWEGPDAAWDAVLGRFDLGLHGLHTPAGLALTQADAIVGPSGRPPAKGWRTLLATHGADTFLRDFSFADSAGVGRHIVDDDRAAFAHPLPDDHFYCQFLRAGLDGQPGWARVTFDWGADGTRASVGLQDQDCRHPRALSLIEKPLRSGHRQVMILPLDSDVEQLRLVAMPTGNGRSVLPSRMTLEVVPDAPARAPTIWARLFGRRA